MKCLSMLLRYIMSTNGLSGQAIWVKSAKCRQSNVNGILKSKFCLIHIKLQYLWPFQNVSGELIFWIFKMLSTKEELKTDKLILWLDVNVLWNIILILFSMFYGKLGKQYGTFYLYYRRKYILKFLLLG